MYIYGALLNHAVNPDGTISAYVKNLAISPALLKEILLLKTEHCTDKDIIACLRGRTVPKDYDYATWIPGTHNHNHN